MSYTFGYNVVDSLQLYNCSNVSVLDGGIQKWIADGYPITTEVPSPQVQNKQLHYKIIILAKTVIDPTYDFSFNVLSYSLYVSMLPYFSYLEYDLII